MAGGAFWIPNYWIGLAPQGSFTIPTPPPPSAGSTVPLAPTWVSGASNAVDAYRPWVHAVLSNVLFAANGYDPNFYWDEDAAALFDMGSEVPTTFAAADGGAGVIPANTELVYRCVFRTNEVGTAGLNKETAPQTVEFTVPGVNSQVDITWSTTGNDPQFKRAVIYRQLQSTGFFVRIADEPIAAGTYTDNELDTGIQLNTPYVRRFRETKPPIFKGVTSHLNKLWGWTGDSSVLYHSQQARTDGEFVVDDFPSANVIEINPNDGDNITAVFSFYGDLIVLKKRGAYVVSGDRASNFVVRQLFDDRGCLAARCILNVEGLYYFIDERGLYVSTLNGEPSTAGAPQGTAESPLSGRQGFRGIWERMNHAAADRFWMFNNEEAGELELHIATDWSPIPDTVVIYDYRNHRFVSVDDGVPGFAGGYLDDALGQEHPVILDELSHVWETGIGNSEGVFAGETTGTILSLGTLQTFTTDAAFDTTDENGLYGSPFERYSTAGDVLDQNRVLNQTTSDIIPLYYSQDPPEVGEFVAVGTIPWSWQITRTWFSTSNKKWVQNVILETGPEASGNIRVDTEADSDGWVLKREFDLDSEDGRHIVNTDDRCWKWTLRASSRYAGTDLQILAMTPYVRSRYDRQ